MINITEIKVGILKTNCYILDIGKTDAVVIDPGAEAEKLLSYLDENNLVPKAILLTHLHFDHTGAVKEIAQRFNIKVYMSGFGTSDAVDERYVEKIGEGSRVEAGGMEFKVLAVPGHSPESVCYLIEDNLFTGDTVFRLTVGRIDLPGGNLSDMKQSLRRIKELPFDDLNIYPGHMQKTTLRFERENNTCLDEDFF